MTFTQTDVDEAVNGVVKWAIYSATSGATEVATHATASIEAIEAVYFTTRTAISNVIAGATFMVVSAATDHAVKAIPLDSERSFR